MHSYDVKSKDANSSYLEYSLNAVKMCHGAYLNPDILYMRSIDIMITERCSLKCKDCSNLMQYYIRPSNIDGESIFDGISQIVQNVDYIYEFRVIEENHSSIAKYTKFWNARRVQGVDRITLFTNATIELDESELVKLDLNKLSFSITHYEGLSRKTQKYKNFR